MAGDDSGRLAVLAMPWPFGDVVCPAGIEHRPMDRMDAFESR
jgi:hypothetical protein